MARSRVCTILARSVTSRPRALGPVEWERPCRRPARVGPTRECR